MSSIDGREPDSAVACGHLAVRAGLALTRRPSAPEASRTGSPTCESCDWYKACAADSNTLLLRHIEIPMPVVAGGLYS